MSARPPGLEAGAGLFILLAGWVAWRYTAVEGPHAVILLVAVVGWLALFTLAAVGLGAAVVRLVTGERLAGLEGWVLAAASGAACLAAVAGLLGALGALHALPLLVALGGAAALGLATVWRVRPAPGLPAPTLPAAILAFAAVLTLLAVATPSPFYDQVHYHLAFPERWLRAGHLVVFPRHAYSYLAANMGLLYTYALSGPGIWGAQALHAWMGALAACAAFALARKIGAGPLGALWAAAFLVATPSFLLSASWAAADLGVAAFGAAGCLMAVDSLGPGRPRGAAWHLLCGVLCGAAFGCKYTALVSVLAPVGVILLGSIAGDRRRGIGRGAGALRILAWAAGAALAFLPWAVRNAALTGNPVYPFLASLFASFLPGGELASALGAAAGIADEAGQAGSWPASLTLRTFDALGAAGWIGPLWLVLLPLWLVATIRGKRGARAMWLGIGVLAGLALWTRIHQLGRYLLPVLAVAAAGVGMAWERFQTALTPGLRRATLVLVALLVLWSVQGGVGEETITRIACTFGRSDPREYLARYVTYWDALPIVHERLPRDARLLLIGEPRALHIDRDVEVEDPFRTPLLVEIAERAAAAPEIARFLRERRISHLLYNEQEAARIARSRGRPGYFSEASPAAAERLREFLEECLDLVGRAGPVRVLALGATCRDPRAGLLGRSGHSG